MQLQRMRARTTIFRNAAAIAAYFLIALGIAYNGLKFHVPWFGGADFYRYAQMVEHPFANAIGAPFAYRVITPTFAHWLLETGLYYRTESAFAGADLVFGGVTFRAETLQALIFANFLMIVAALAMLHAALRADARDFAGRALAFVLPLLMLLAFSTVVHGFAGLTEGGSQFFICALILLRRQGQFAMFAVTAFVAVAQRELIPLLLAIWLVARAPGMRPDRWSIVALGAFASYFCMRWLVPLPGYPEQVSPSGLLTNIIGFRPDRDFVFQALLENTLPMAILALAVLLPGMRARPLFAPLGVLAAVIALGIALGLQNNIGRIANLVTPMFVIALGEMIARARRDEAVDDAQSAKAASSM